MRKRISQHRENYRLGASLLHDKTRLPERNTKKKSKARCPAPKIVSTLFPRKIGFDFD
jgi:hypothetical protein